MYIGGDDMVIYCLHEYSDYNDRHERTYYQELERARNEISEIGYRCISYDKDIKFKQESDNAYMYFENDNGDQDIIKKLWIEKIIVY